MELKPCPWCGETPIFSKEEYAWGEWLVKCVNVDCPMHQVGTYAKPTKEEVAKIWNNRTPDSCASCDFAIFHDSVNGYDTLGCMHPDSPEDAIFESNGYNRPEWCPWGKGYAVNVEVPEKAGMDFLDTLKGE